MPKQKSGGIAITGLVFSCLFFIPIIPLVGGILGIIAVAAAPPGRPKGAAIMAIVLGFTFGLGGGCTAAIAIPAFIKYIRRSKTVEAQMNTRMIFDDAVVYYEAEQVGSDGKVFSHRFPPSTDWTPAEGACGYPGQKIPPSATAWQTPAWHALRFSVDDPSYFQYRFRALTGDGSHPGDEAIAEARADLNCDGIYSQFERRLVVGAAGTIQSPSGLQTANDLE
jgi:type IV pilus assembly protein PilA